MKKAKSVRRSSAAKAKRAPITVDEYLAQIPAASRKIFNALRSAIRSAVPRDSVEIISYGIPAFKHDRVLVWFAAFSNHCSLFPTSSIIEEFKSELKDFSTSKGTIHFPIDRPIPTRLVKKLVKARVAQTANK
jgi:uncharacterized protein YdhG (YjbR/CyaY superfamily)